MYSRCKQKYSYKRLLALHPTEKRTYPEAFKFPSCCSCYIKYQDDYVGRSNFRKLDGKVDVTEQRNGQSPAVAGTSAVAAVPRESRVMSTVQNETTIVETIIIEPQTVVHHIDNSPTIEIMSQSADLTSHTTANSNSSNSSTSPAISTVPKKVNET